MTVIALTVDELKTQYPKVWEANKARLEQLATKGKSTIRICHNNEWLEVSVG